MNKYYIIITSNKTYLTHQLPEEDYDVMSAPSVVAEHPSLASIDYNEVDTGVCSWVLSIFTLSDEKFLAKCGMDAVQYLKFQRHLIIFVLIMTVVCIGIILPINFQVIAVY